MLSSSKPYALVLSATTVSTGAAAAAGAPRWVTVASTAVPLAAGIALAAADQVRAARRDRRRAERREADDAQRRSLESQAVRVVYSIPDPDRRAEVLLRLIKVHVAAQERDGGE
jgi:hypothetical protein